MKPRCACVTGASSGIGEAIARQLAAAGTPDLILCARRKDRLETVAAELEAKGAGVRIAACDLATPEGRDTLWATAADGEPVDLLVNNAGFGLLAPFTEADPESTFGMIDLNVTALTDLTRRFVAPMLEKGRGTVLNVASGAAFVPMPNFAVYSATKAYVLSFSEALDAEVRGRGVRIIALCPGGTATEFIDVAGWRGRNTGPAPLMTPEQVAEAGLRAVRRDGPPVVVPGFLNAVGIKLTRFLPRRLVIGVAGRYSR